MADHGHAVDHDFHIPNRSVWPPLSCLGGGLIAFGAIMCWHVQPLIIGQSVLVAGLLLAIVSAFQWFFMLTKESRERGFLSQPFVLDLANRYGMIFFIASEVMFFSAFFAAYFYLRSHNPAWPPANIATLPIDLPTLGTLILLTSGATITWAHHSMVHARRKDTVLATALTWMLGCIFLCLQVFEYSHAGYSISSGVYGSTFFMLTGFHGFHVLVGSLMLMFLSYRLSKGDFTSKHHFYFEATAWYWHFVDVVWIGLFLFVYVL
jgi:cytochrome c oxidase subunit III